MSRAEGTSRSEGLSQGRVGPYLDGVRLQKVLARAGIASRRAAEQMISQGRVSVDGTVVREQGLRVHPEQSVVRVDGMRLELRPDVVHLAMNKPRGVHCTMSDDRGRPCIGDFVADRMPRLFHVGRLDADTEGLLLLTNDGELAHRLMHPSYGVRKAYLAEVPGPVSREIGRRLRAGVELEDGPVAVDSCQVVQALPGKALIEVVLHEGRKHIVRRLLAGVGHPPERLVRTAIGDLRLGAQRSGTLRTLSQDEIGTLYRAVGL
ncbi:MAG: rRNA pseudouridine synthase [Actinomycetota bacterium]|nr:rRNA pseudouridine synthase [Actinomycetota bacterium]